MRGCDTVVLWAREGNKGYRSGYGDNGHGQRERKNKITEAGLGQMCVTGDDGKREVLILV